MKKCGASPGADMKSGGSDGVFTRLGTKTDMSYAMSFLGDDYRVIISPDVLNRTDWYAHRGDSFGAARTTDARWQKRLGSMDFIKSETGSKYSNNSNAVIGGGEAVTLADGYHGIRAVNASPDVRCGSMDFIKSETGSKYSNNSFTSDNEILFRHGISTDTFVGISCQDERTSLKWVLVVEVQPKDSPHAIFLDFRCDGHEVLRTSGTNSAKSAWTAAKASSRKSATPRN
mgnify:CR=1 FL=1